MRLPRSIGKLLTCPNGNAFHVDNHIYPSDCQGGILGAPCRARRSICKTGCAVASAAALVGCSGITGGVGVAVCIAGVMAAAEGCRSECDRMD